MLAAARAWHRCQGPLRTAVRARASKGDDLDELAKRLGHRWNNVERLRSAVSHPAHRPPGEVDRYKAKRFERFEFLGDRVLNLVIAEYLHETYPNEDEATANLRIMKLIRSEALLAVGRGWRLPSPPGFSAPTGSNGITADTVESVVAAVFRDAGYEAARNFVRNAWAPLFAEMDRDGPPSKDAKTRLIELANARGMPLPKYEVVARGGKSHQPEFTVRGHFDGISEVATARAAGGRRPRRRAEMLAAEKILRRLEELDKDDDVRRALRGLG